MSYTTKLLTDRLDQALPPRHRLILAAVVAWVALGAIVGSLGSHRATPAPAQIIILATATAGRPAELGRASPPERSEPRATATAEPPTEVPALAVATPEVIYRTVYVERSAPAAAPVQEAQPEPTPTLDWYSDIPTAPPEIVALCQTEKARTSWVCGGGQP